MMHLASVSQMIADLGHHEDEQQNTSRPPHPSSLSGELAELCQKSRDEQIWLVEERFFERRLKSEVMRRHREGWAQDRLAAFADRHRRRWREQRLALRPRVVRDREEPYRDVIAELAVPLHWTEPNV